MAEIRVGTSAFTAEGWLGTFYPEGMQPRDFLSYYATKFDTVEVDSTFYRTPAASTVKGWRERTPGGFVFALKVPQVITHEKMLVDCKEDLKHFVEMAELLGEKLGPMLLQFPYFNKSKFKSGKEFLGVLKPFLKMLPKEREFALEIRNKYWINKELLELLRENGVAFAMIDQAWVPRPWEMKEQVELITAEFTYVRWLGDRKGIEEVTKTWDKTVMDREVEIAEWVKILKRVVARGVKAFAFANNHYAGHGPGTVKLFWEEWNRK